MRSSNPGFHSKFAALTPALLLVTLWLTLHGYRGITGDGQIYAFQALSRLNPQLAGDLYLQNTSQDQFTVFSPLYSWCIDQLGLEGAARLLTLLFTLWFLAAAWRLACALAGPGIAWLAAAALLMVAGDYGAAGVFRILDASLTARLPAEALIVTALACYIRGRRRLSALLTLGAILIHPLIALPGLLLIVCLGLPLRVSIGVAIGGVFATLALAVAAIHMPAPPQLFAVMDGPWLEVVRERSQFLFLQLWSIRDWGVNAQPFVSLGFTAVAVPDERMRKLCAAAALVGAAGLAVALIGGLMGPVAILVQGQAWRWVWVPAFIAIALVPVTAVQAWRDERGGPACSLWLLAGWMFSGMYGTALVTLAFVVWLRRAHDNPRRARYFRWLPAVLGAVILVCILTNFGALSGASIHDVFAMKFPAVLLVTLVWWSFTTSRTSRMPTVIATMLMVLSIWAFPAAFKQTRTLASAADIREFADWANAIPPTGTVLVAPPKDVGAFVWFTLGRPNYMSLDQSSGVVFSRATALEVRRRSEVLLPLMDPEWKIMSSLGKSGRGRTNEAKTHPLTQENLVRVCADPQLGFVVSPAVVGFEPLRHDRRGAWMDWNLYDCRKVRSAPSVS